MSVVADYNFPKGFTYDGKVTVDFQYEDQAVKIYGETESIHTESITKEADLWQYQAVCNPSQVWSANDARCWTNRASEGDIYHGQAITLNKTGRIIGWMCAAPGDSDPAFECDQGFSEATVVVDSQCAETGVKAQVAALFKAYIKKAVQERCLVETDFPSGRIEKLPLHWLTVTAPNGNPTEYQKKKMTLELLSPVMNFYHGSQGVFNVVGAPVYKLAVRV